MELQIYWKRWKSYQPKFANLMQKMLSSAKRLWTRSSNLKDNQSHRPSCPVLLLYSPPPLQQMTIQHLPLTPLPLLPQPLIHTTTYHLLVINHHLPLIPIQPTLSRCWCCTILRTILPPTRPSTTTPRLCPLRARAPCARSEPGERGEAGKRAALSKDEELCITRLLPGTIIRKASIGRHALLKWRTWWWCDTNFLGD